MDVVENGSGLDVAEACERISGEIARKIESGELAPGERIGAERDLARRYGVSRWVIRRAFGGLVSEGLVIRVTGRSGGMFVAPITVVRDLETLVGLPQYLRAQGLDSGTTVLGTRVVDADATLAELMEMDVGSPVLEVERARYTGGLPLSLETIWLPGSLFPGLFNFSLVGSLYELLEAEYGVKRGEAVESVGATAANPKIAVTLQLTVGSPILTVRRVARMEDGRVFEVGVEQFRGDRIELRVHTSGMARMDRALVGEAGNL